MSPIPLHSKRRPPKTTYSRAHRKHASTNIDNPHPKRRRLSDSTTPSSSIRTFSPGPALITSVESKETPSSSPPPSQIPHKSVFNLTRRTPTFTIRKTSRIPTAPQRLTQLTIDLGQSIRTSCHLCGMSYHPSFRDDEVLHKRFHAKSVGGIDFLLKSSSVPTWESTSVEGGGEKEYILRIDRKSSASEKRKAREVLEVVDSELSAAEISDDVLWSEFKSTVGNGDGGERFKIFLYIFGKKCVGLCLAERIENSYRVLESHSNTAHSDSTKFTEFLKLNPKGSSISISPTAHSSILGISRIWTCSSHRRQGIAKKLLDAARKNFIYGMEINKSLVAFSQPTESGGLLARRWFGDKKETEKANGNFLAVYIEET
ncbi:hypothetical protein RUND412_009188 [Rhizina undulata]